MTFNIILYTRPFLNDESHETAKCFSCEIFNIHAYRYYEGQLIKGIRSKLFENK